MSKQNAGPVVRKADEHGSIWITYFRDNQKYWGKIYTKDFVKLGNEPVRVWVPMYLNSTAGKEATYRLDLDTVSYTEPFQYYNTRLWTSWQKMNPALYEELDGIVEKFREQGLKK